MKRIAGVALLLVGMYALLGASNPGALSESNLVDVANRQGFSGILVLSAGILILSGSIDLSLGSVVALGAVVFGVLLRKGVNPYAALPLTLALGTLIGLVQGLLVHYLRLQSFLVTLCGMFVFRGLARLVANAALGKGQEVGLTRVVTENPAFAGPLNDLKFALVGYDSAGLLQFPGTLAVLVVLAAALAVVLQGTVHGRYWFALGYSETAARYAGVPVGRYRVASFAVASTLGTLAGVILILTAGSVKPDNAGQALELQAITGAVLGGVSLRGGEGTVLGMALGAAVLPLLGNMMTFWDIPDDVIPLVTGLTLFAGSVADEVIRRRAARRR